MLIIPAIDLKDGRCVRLRQGDLRHETAYSDDPPAMARYWEQLGARLLHIVDLDGAFEGHPKNIDRIEAILKAVSIPVQIGGGIRTMETIRRYLVHGSVRVVLGTAVLENPALLERACTEFPSRILVGLDAKEGRIAVRGWTSVSGTSASNLIPQLAVYPLAGLIYTDIAKDGMLEGPNLPALADVLRCAPMPVIASGGISSIDDIRAVKSLGHGITGAIIGKALYDGKLDLKEAIQAASREPTPAC
ncbi:MAG TPA: 1-(5-phosphoribosyl)-5-[(5-phosphoribosylamino)methylideneamino]imidazole-4-carboxamide isomerase [Nitrospiraceae bacterium]|nr:1-(5-phosphoribosyl)-5-[(5-phosphoribosylamino)methylideneamino]imidazole-4-carboxamide isomerase [Nitrospiraceae bacterium]